MLIDGWLKDQMQKAADEVEKWPEWMKKLVQIEEKMEKKRASRKSSLKSEMFNET